MKKIVTILFIFFQSLTFYGQEITKKSINIYFEGNGYLQLFIESTLNSLIDNNDEPLFDNVIVLNRFIDENEFQAKSQQLINTYLTTQDKSKSTYSNKEIKIRKKSKGNLTKYDYYLKVKTITLVELVEFQFQLFETIKNADDDDDIGIPFNNINKLLGSEDLFINPKEKNYKDDIGKAIQRLFKKSNNAPIAELKFLDKSLKSGDTIYIPVNTNIVFDGSQSGDYENEAITYNWRNIVPKKSKVQTANKIELLDNVSIQNFNIKKTGYYNIGFSVYDGIESSSEINIHIKTIKKPIKIELLDSVIVFRQNYGILFNKKYFEEKSSLIKILNDSLDYNKIVVSSKDLGIRIEEKDNEVINTNIDSTNTFVIKDNFKNSTNIKYYLYSKDSYGLLSNPTTLYHQSEFLTMISLGAKGSYHSLNYNFRNGDTLNLLEEEEEEWYSNSGSYKTKSINQVFTTHIFINISLSNRLSFELGFNTNFNTLIFDNYSLMFPAISNFNLEYSFFKSSIYKKKKPALAKLLLIYSSYSGADKINLVGEEYTSPTYGTIYTTSLGYGLEVEMEVINQNWFKSNISLIISNSHFLNKQTKTLRDFQIGLGLNFYFKDYYHKK